MFNFRKAIRIERDRRLLRRCHDGGHVERRIFEHVYLNDVIRAVQEVYIQFGIEPCEHPYELECEALVLRLIALCYANWYILPTLSDSLGDAIHKFALRRAVDHLS